MQINNWLMKKNISVVAKASVAYLLANLIVKGVNIITLPLFTRMMPAEEIGYTTVFNSWQSLVGVVAGLALCSGSYAAAMQDYKEERDAYEASVLQLSTLSAIVISLIYFIGLIFDFNFMGLSTDLITIMFVGFIFLPATEFWLARERFEYRYKSVIVVTLSSIFLATFFSVAAVVYGKWEAVAHLGAARIYGNMFVTILFGLFFYVKILKSVKFKIITKFWASALLINIPLVFHSLSKLILDVSDRVMISKMLGETEVGIYGVLYGISTLSLIVWNAINNSIVPLLFDRLSQGESAEKKISKTILQLMIFYGIIAFLLTLCAPEIVKILATSEYYSAIYMMPPVASGIYFTAMYNLYGNVLIYHKATKHVMIATFVAASMNILLNYLFIGKFGYIAAAYTTLICFVVLAILQFLAMKRVHGHDPYNSNYLWTISMLTVLLCMGCTLLYEYIFLRYLILFWGLLFLFMKRNILISVIKK